MAKRNFGCTINVLLKESKCMKQKFIYTNVNPEGIEEEDCVNRALSLALKLDYKVVSNLLQLIGDFYQCDKLCICCYHKLLDDVFELTPQYCENGETVEDIIEQFSDDILIIRINGHLTSSYYGTILDTYDCRDRKVDRFWRVK